MLDGLLCECYLPQSSRHQLPHLFSSAQDGDGLLVLVPIDLYLVHQLLINQLVFVDQHQQSIQLSI